MNTGADEDSALALGEAITNHFDADEHVSQSPRSTATALASASPSSTGLAINSKHASMRASIMAWDDVEGAEGEGRAVFDTTTGTFTYSKTSVQDETDGEIKKREKSQERVETKQKHDDGEAEEDVGDHLEETGDEDEYEGEVGEGTCLRRVAVSNLVIDIQGMAKCETPPTLPPFRPSTLGRSNH